jgi:multiple sugar transport system substrate-binding protein
VRSMGKVASALTLTVIAGAALSGCGGHATPTKPHQPRPSHTVAAGPTQLRLGVFGSPAELAAYQQAVSTYDAEHADVTISVQTWPTAVAMMKDLASGSPAPDVFLAGREDLAQLEQNKTIAPVDEPLAARNVDLGDEYSREALEAFSADRHLQCMPYAADPDVIYYNTDLVDFDAMKAAGLVTPNSLDSGKWTVSTFAAAVQYASGAAAHVRGFYLPPTLEGLAPYLYSGQGKVFDDETTPTSLAFSDPGSQQTLEQLLPAVTTPGATLTAQQLKKHTPLQWFERGRLAMMVGDRSIVPELREQTGLDWDVISLPSVSGTTTIGDYTGLCLSRTTKTPQAAADLLVYLVSDTAEAIVAQAGSIVPVNNEVALSDDFLQPDQQPAHAKVFVNSIRQMHVLPVSSAVAESLDGAVGGLLSQLLQPGADVAGLSAAIDAASQPILAQALPSASASATGSATATASATASATATPAG